MTRKPAVESEIPPPEGMLPPTADLFFNWTIERRLDGTSIEAGQRSICRITSYDPLESEALARLLVKTPEMLRQLERLAKKAGDDPELDALLSAIHNGE
jgi:hypothetical protein